MMRKLRFISVAYFVCFGFVFSISTPAFSKDRNQVAGTWRIVSAKLDHDGTVIEPFGPNPGGLLVFTEDFHFAETIVNLDVAKFASGNSATGTEAENKAAMSGGLGNSGTYTVDNQGNFSSEHLISSTFPNWDGLNRDTR